MFNNPISYFIYIKVVLQFAYINKKSGNQQLFFQPS